MAHYPLRINGEEYDATPENTALYTYAGVQACFNHVFILLPKPEDGSPQQGMYFFEQSPRENIRNIYTRLGKFAIKNNFPTYRNLLEVSEADSRMFFSVALQDLEGTDTPPGEWIEQ